MNDRFTQTGWRRAVDQVGHGKLTGKLVVDQVYAKYHHERLDLHHPRGGGPKYLEGPLFANYANYLSRVAQQLLVGDPVRAMADAMESLNTAMSRAAPIEFNNLRRSGSPKVYDNGQLAYNRAAWQRRLSREELKQLGRLRYRRGRR